MKWIDSRLDLSRYCDGDFVFTSEGSELLEKETEEEGISIARMREGVIGTIGETKAFIERHLSSGTEESRQALAAVVRMEQFEWMKGYDYELALYDTAVQIFQMEQSLGAERTIFDVIRSTGDFRTVYSELVFLFRRIQLEMPREDVERKFEEVLERKLSVFAMLQVLRNCVVGNKACVGLGVASCYRDCGRNEEALLVRTVSEDWFGRA